jgi:predicted nucleotidyltransferase
MNAGHGLSEKTVGAIRLVLARHPEVERAVLFGSRAKGNYKPGSDIDLALAGPGLGQKTVNQMYEELDDLPIPYCFSLVLFSKMTDPEVISHISRIGIVFYEKEAVPARA